MPINNPTEFTVEKRHTFQINNNLKNERLLIDVLENTDDGFCYAILYNLFHHSDQSLLASAPSVDEALSSLLEKISHREWADLNETLQKLDV